MEIYGYNWTTSDRMEWGFSLKRNSPKRAENTSG